MKVFLGLLLCLPIIVFSQEISLKEDEIRKMEFSGVFKSSISLEGFGKSGLIGVSYDVLLSKRWRWGIGGGYAGFGTAIKWYPTGVKRFKPVFNIGIRCNTFFPKNSAPLIMYSMPIGLSYFGPSRINMEFDIAPTLKRPINANEKIEGIAATTKIIWFSVKLGYRFSFYSIKRKRQLNRLD